MSASLVGSEMCIRDRNEIPRTPEGSSSRRSRRSCSACRGSASYRSPPVSYTHLTLPTICSV
eukprot:12760193-Alexandrium_andersonii.AAC.1